MPNTLVHIALQGLVILPAARTAATFPLILLGAVIPDIPWILQRAVKIAGCHVDPYGLRAYAIVQASLFMSVFMAAACAQLFRRRLQAWLVMAAGCLLHLLLDASQIKWASGVNLLAPADWRLAGWGVMWPENIFWYATAVLGLVAFGFFSLRPDSSIGIGRPTPSRLLSASAITAIYLALPIGFADGPVAADNHYLATLQSTARTGRPVEFDRSAVSRIDGFWFVETYAGENLRLVGFDAPGPGTYSLRGIFDAPSVVRVTDWHRHTGFRDPASIVGLLLIAAWFSLAVMRRVKKPLRRSDGFRFALRSTHDDRSS